MLLYVLTSAAALIEQNFSPVLFWVQGLPKVIGTLAVSLGGSINSCQLLGAQEHRRY